MLSKARDGMSEGMVVSDRPPQQVEPTPYMKKLIQEVQRKLQKAFDSPSQRADVLHQLFTDIALEVDSRAQARLYTEEDLQSARPRDHPLCFYEVLARHYARMPGDGNEALSLFVKLWSQSLAAQIFTLLFYEWLFSVPSEDSDGYLRYSTAFVEGASTIFWIDLQSDVQRFFTLYHYTLTEVVMNPQRYSVMPTRGRCELVLMLSRFFLFYEPASKLLDFFEHFPPFPSDLGPADIFVIELADQLHKVKVEPPLLRYLKGAQVLHGVNLDVPTSTRLRTTLYGLTSPGGPMYPTRPVRHAAWEALDCLFPVGRNSRLLISMFFRLMHPYYWPVSFWNFVVTLMMGGVQRVFFHVNSTWEYIFGRRLLPRDQE